MAWLNWVGAWFVLYILFYSIIPLGYPGAGILATVLIISTYLATAVVHHYGRNMWWGASLPWKFGVLTIVAMIVQLLASPDAVTTFDIVVAPVSAAIWLVVGLALWKLLGWANDWLESDGEDRPPTN